MVGVLRECGGLSKGVWKVYDVCLQGIERVSGGYFFGPTWEGTPIFGALNFMDINNFSPRFS